MFNVEINRCEMDMIMSLLMKAFPLLLSSHFWFFEPMSLYMWVVGVFESSKHTVEIKLD